MKQGLKNSTFWRKNSTVGEKIRQPESPMKQKNPGGSQILGTFRGQIVAPSFLCVHPKLAEI